MQVSTRFPSRFFKLCTSYAIIILKQVSNRNVFPINVLLLLSSVSLRQLGKFLCADSSCKTFLLLACFFVARHSIFSNLKRNYLSFLTAQQLFPLYHKASSGFCDANFVNHIIFLTSWLRSVVPTTKATFHQPFSDTSSDTTWLRYSIKCTFQALNEIDGAKRKISSLAGLP